MGAPLIRDGKLVGDPLKGVDLASLSQSQKSELLSAVNKIQDGEDLRIADLNAIIKARAVSRGKGKPLSTAEKITHDLERLKKLLR